MIYFFLFSWLLSVVRCVETVWSCYEMLCKAEGGSVGGDFASVGAWKEIPYLAILEDESRIFCLGVLINSDRLLTLASCTYKDDKSSRNPSSIKIRVQSIDKKGGETKNAQEVIIHPKCAGEPGKLLGKNCDFAVIKAQSPFSSVTTAPFIGTYYENIRSEIHRREGCDDHIECACVGVSFGRHTVWKEKDWIWTPKHDGREEPALLKFGIRLLRPTSCNTWSRYCCMTAGTRLFGTKLYSETTVRCAMRGNVDARCMGESGGPIVCKGRVIGLIKGNNYCDVRSRAFYHGEIIYVGLHDGIKFVKEHYKLNREVNPPGPDIDKLNISKQKPPDSLDNETLADYESYVYNRLNIHFPSLVVLFVTFYFVFSINC